ncbi:hypothetical protein [Nostoc sp. UHCC 0251]|uniref:hypothetical protein n=1 Tax=Nostoc sp. UHCC 0251 TaxID=3110240 RepID=UPI002B210AA0|nr:hypothetical protein [Nostoc sp. UHCC 0251]MEA5623244.1 hypothetical protein [Nostoc sp. UHCC 0251]
MPKKLLYVFQVLNMRSLSKVNLSGSQSCYSIATSASAIKAIGTGDSLTLFSSIDFHQTLAKCAVL